MVRNAASPVSKSFNQFFSFLYLSWSSPIYKSAAVALIIYCLKFYPWLGYLFAPYWKIRRFWKSFQVIFLIFDERSPDSFIERDDFFSGKVFRTVQAQIQWFDYWFMFNAFPLFKERKLYFRLLISNVVFQISQRNKKNYNLRKLLNQFPQIGSFVTCKRRSASHKLFQ